MPSLPRRIPHKPARQSVVGARLEHCTQPFQTEVGNLLCAPTTTRMVTMIHDDDDDGTPRVVVAAAAAAAAAIDIHFCQKRKISPGKGA